MGKTTMVRFLVENNHLDTYKIILNIQLSSKICKEIKALPDIAKELRLQSSQLRNRLEDAASDALIILDGISELTKVENWEETVFAEMMFGKEFPSATRLLLSRPSGVIHLLNNTKIDRLFRIQGLSDVNLLLSSSDNEWIATLCKQHPLLLDMCKIPLIAKGVRQFCERNNKRKGNLTIADICMHIVTEIIKRRLEQTSHDFDVNFNLFSFPEEHFDDFSKLCKFAFQTLASSHLLVSSEQMERFASTFSLTESFSLSLNETFGLVEVVCTRTTTGSCTYSFQFVHLLIQEFLAGYYVQLLPPLDQLNLLYKHAFEMLGSSAYWLRFFFGLLWRRSLTFDPTKFMISTLLEFLVHCLMIWQDDTHSDIIFKLLLCVAETKEDELWKKFASNLGGSVSLQLTIHEFEQHMWTIASMVSCSEVRDWRMSTSERNFSTSRALDNFELYTSAKMSKIVVDSLDEYVQISPKVGIEAASKRQRDAEKFKESADRMVSVMNYYQCRAVREILQRVLKIYTVIKLKGDSSNPTYVSFLSCECFKKKLQDNVLFDPYVPYHFLEVTSKKTLKRIQEENKVHLATHDGKAMELVILLKPYLRRVTLTIPHTSEIHCIVFMSEELAQMVNGEGAISCSLSSFESSEMLGAYIEETITTAPSEMVRPSLPLPPQAEQSVRASTVLPPVTTPGTTPVTIPHPIGHGEPEHEQTHLIRQQQLPDSPKSGGGEIGNGSPGSGFTFSPHFNRLQPTTSDYQQQHTATVTPSQQTLHTKSSIKPGAVLFTSVPGQIPADQIHPLPDESHQMRRGGNGQIFRGIIGGMNVVYKKTNYRSKEYAIITKIKHKNIVRLLAFMYGTENPTHKRRHFCYHIMPQLSGDCARMLTDKEELTIRELYKKHGHNIRKMGVIRGNLKYLLKEILQGIRYLHSLHIAHRDIKGSNILLKFFCSCSNPLECGCDTKYQVHICDFDAGVELDDSERLPPTQIGSRTSRPSHTQYVCVPVGTNGFRSPECSMLAIANAPDAFSPPITTRCDIWSVEILTVRMLIGATGPSEQRKMALLLLHYHRQRYMREGLHRYGYLEVDRLVTDQLLNMPKLVQEVGWLKGAVRFVECCVAVDPLARHSAEALLQHDFLY